MTVYTAVYGDYDSIRPQPLERRVFTDATDPSPFADPRLAAKWWKCHPEAVAPGDVTIWVDGSMDIRSPSFADALLSELGDDELLLFRHPWRDDIYAEERESRRGAKYDGQPMRDQVEAYRAAGHPERWGLMHGACLVRRDTPAVRALDAVWWAEIERWSLQDQLSLPFVLRGSNVRWHWHPAPFFEFFAQRPHLGPDVWREA